MSTHKLVIAEKPSVALAIAKALGVKDKKDGYYQGAGYIISWCVGHLVGLADAAAYDEKYAKWRYEDLPILPQQWKLTTGADKAKQFKILSGLMRDSNVSSLICATDAGREGELIFRFVYERAGCRKPFQRLWISSMEDAAIREGFAKLKDGKEYDNLYASALCRSKADWLVGINATRLFSTLYGGTLNVGRVQTPTLAMLVDRDANINGFQKENYYHTRIACGGFQAASDRIKNKVEASNMRDSCDGKRAVVVSVKQEQKSVHPPRLYDLTTLQREANRLYGYTAQQTLDLVQALYEKKLVTYPRTDSCFLTEDMRSMASGITAYLMKTPPFAHGQPFTPDMGRVINNDKVTDHHAIIPTVEFMSADTSSVPESEKNILALIAARLLCATADRHIFETVAAVLDCEGHSFTAKGKTVKQYGWKSIEQSFRVSIKNKVNDKDSDADEQDAALPPLIEGQRFDGVAASVTEHTTAPPKPYTEDTLLAAMETAGNEDLTDPDAEKRGLGTPATRASIIEKLVTSGFAQRKGKQLLPTPKGIDLIGVLPENIKSAKLTAEWENSLTQIARGNLAPGEFMRGIENLAAMLVRGNTAPLPDKAGLFREQRGEAKAIGTCPRCSSGVAEGKKNFYCTNRPCGFVMWKDDKFFTAKKKTLTKGIAADLLNNGKTLVNGLFSAKSGKTYDAVVLLADTGGKYVNYKLDFGERSS